jgi:hypothetical protein
VAVSVPVTLEPQGVGFPHDKACPFYVPRCEEVDAYRRTAAAQVEALHCEGHALLLAVCRALGVVRAAAWVARKLA